MNFAIMVYCGCVKPTASKPSVGLDSVRREVSWVAAASADPWLAGASIGAFNTHAWLSLRAISTLFPVESLTVMSVGLPSAVENSAFWAVPVGVALAACWAFRPLR